MKTARTRNYFTSVRKFKIRRISSTFANRKKNKNYRWWLASLGSKPNPGLKVGKVKIDTLSQLWSKAWLNLVTKLDQIWIVSLIALGSEARSNPDPELDQLLIVSFIKSGSEASSNPDPKLDQILIKSGSKAWSIPDPMLYQIRFRRLIISGS